MQGRVGTLGLAVVATVVTGAAAQASVGDGGTIAFSTNRDQGLYRATIYSIREDGAGRRVVAVPTPAVRDLVRSPDGQRILFERTIDDVGALFVARRSGAGAVRITPPSLGTSLPYGGASFSPNGRKVAFGGSTVCSPYDCRYAIYVVDVDGRNLQQVAAGGSNPSWAPGGRRIAFTGNIDSDDEFPASVHVATLDGRDRRIVRGSDPIWAPRGDRIVYRPPNTNFGACLVDANGSGRSCIRGSSMSAFHWSPDGSQLAFRRGNNGRLAVVGSDGRHLRVFLDQRQMSPGAWSSDGRRIAYVQVSGQIWVRNANGRSVPRKLTHELPDTDLRDLQWRSGRISYMGYLAANDQELALMNTDGSGVRTLTHNLVEDREPAWSPDGATLAFSRGQTLSTLRLIGADGESDRALTREGAWHDSNPAWSPDGRFVAFVRARLGSFYGTLMTVEVATGDLRTISPLYTVVQGKVSWSPDGALIAFSMMSTPWDDLHVVAPDGSGLRRIATGRRAFAPSWSPDGSRLAFLAAADDSGALWDLSTIRPDGSGLTRIVENAGFTGASWAPDGRRFVFSRRITSEENRIVLADTDGRETQLTADVAVSAGPAWSR